jgi:hypothetical protein
MKIFHIRNGHIGKKPIMPEKDILKMTKWTWTYRKTDNIKKS